MFANAQPLAAALNACSSFSPRSKLARWPPSPVRLGATPIPVAFYTQNDIDLWEDCCARAIMAAGGTDEDVVQVAYGYGLFTGGPGLNGGSHKVGCLTLPMSSGNTDRQLQFMEDLGSTILCCTPSYAAYLAESIE